MGILIKTCLLFHLSRFVASDPGSSNDSPYSCGAQLRLPEDQFNVTIGEPPLEELTLDDLQARGYSYAEYMQGAGGRPPTALGAKFRNFRVCNKNRSVSFFVFVLHCLLMHLLLPPVTLYPLSPAERTA